jgi:hypothetical protein
LIYEAYEVKIYDVFYFAGNKIFLNIYAVFTWEKKKKNSDLYYLSHTNTHTHTLPICRAKNLLTLQSLLRTGRRLLPHVRQGVIPCAGEEGVEM